MPGYEWAPAWVSWRTGGDYVGWAPLPPGGDRVYEGRAITGGVDVEFGIGPLYYNFVDVRYIGEPVLRGRILAPSRNVTIINRTVNVTNITYSNSIVYNYGPDYNQLNRYSTRPIQRLKLQRETTLGANLGQEERSELQRVSATNLPFWRQRSKSAATDPPSRSSEVAKTIIDCAEGVHNRHSWTEMSSKNPKTFQRQFPT